MDLGIRFETRRQRYIKQLRASVKSALFSTLYLITRDNGVYQNLAIFGLFFDSVQFVGFILNGLDFGPGFAPIRDALNVAMLSVEKTSLSVFQLVFAFITIMVWSMIILASYVTVAVFQTGGVLSEIWLLRVLRVLAGLFTTILYIPMVRMYAAVFKCSGGEWTPFFEDDGITCWSGTHVSYAVPAIATLLVYVLFSTFVSFMVFDYSMRSGRVTARANSRAEGFYSFFKVVLALSTVANDGSVPLAIACAGFEILLAYFFFAPPYFRTVPNSIRVSVFAGAGTGAVVSLIARAKGRADDDGDASTSNDHGLFAAVLAAIALGGAFGGALSLLRNNRISRKTESLLSARVARSRYGVGSGSDASAGAGTVGSPLGVTAAAAAAAAATAEGAAPHHHQVQSRRRRHNADQGELIIEAASDPDVAAVARAIIEDCASFPVGWLSNGGDGIEVRRIVDAAADGGETGDDMNRAAAAAGGVNTLGDGADARRVHPRWTKLFAFRVRERVRFLPRESPRAEQVGLCIAVLRAGIKAAPTQPDLPLSLAKLLIDFVVVQHSSMTALIEARRLLSSTADLPMALDNENMRFGIAREIEDIGASGTGAVGAGAGGPKSLSVIGAAQFKRDKRQARVSSERAVAWIGTFWSRLDAGGATEAELNFIAERVEHFENRAADAFERLLRRHTANPELLRSYGAFVDTVYADTEAAEECFVLADEVEERLAAAATRSITHAHQQPGGHTPSANAALQPLQSMHQYPTGQRHRRDSMFAKNGGVLHASAAIRGTMSRYGSTGGASARPGGSATGGGGGGSVSFSVGHQSSSSHGGGGGGGGGGLHMRQPRMSEGGTGSIRSGSGRMTDSSSSTGAGIGARFAGITMRRRSTRPRSVRTLLRVIWLLIIATVAMGPPWYLLSIGSLGYAGFETEVDLLELSHMGRAVPLVALLDAVRSVQLTAANFTGDVSRGDLSFESVMGPGWVAGEEPTTDDIRLMSSRLLTSFNTDNQELFATESTTFSSALAELGIDDGLEMISFDLIEGNPPRLTVTTRLSVWAVVLEFVTRVAELLTETEDAAFGWPHPVGNNRSFRYVVNNGVLVLTGEVSWAALLHHITLTQKLEQNERRVLMMFFIYIGVMVAFFTVIGVLLRRAIVQVGGLRLFATIPAPIIRQMKNRFSGASSELDDVVTTSGAGVGASAAGVDASTDRSSQDGDLTSDEGAETDENGVKSNHHANHSSSRDSRDVSLPSRTSHVPARGRHTGGADQHSATQLNADDLHRSLLRRVLNDKTIGVAIIMSLALVTVLASIRLHGDPFYSSEAAAASIAEVRVARLSFVAREVVINDTLIWHPLLGGGNSSGGTDGLLPDYLSVLTDSVESDIYHMVFGTADLPAADAAFEAFAGQSNFWGGTDLSVDIDGSTTTVGVGIPASFFLEQETLSQAMTLHALPQRGVVNSELVPIDTGLEMVTAARALKDAVESLVLLVKAGSRTPGPGAPGPAASDPQSDMQERLVLLAEIEATSAVLAARSRECFNAAIAEGREKINSARDLFLAFFWLTYAAMIVILLFVFVIRMGSSLERRSQRAHAMMRLIPIEAVRTDPGLAAVASFLSQNYDAGSLSKDQGAGASSQGEATICVDAMSGKITSADGASASLVGTGIIGVGVWTVLPAVGGSGDEPYVALEEGGPHFVELRSKKGAVTAVRAYRGSLRIGVRTEHVYKFIPERRRSTAHGGHPHRGQEVGPGGTADLDASIDVVYSLLEHSPVPVLAVAKSSRRIVFLGGGVTAQLGVRVQPGDSIDRIAPGATLEDGSTWTIGGPLRKPPALNASGQPSLFPAQQQHEHHGQHGAMSFAISVSPLTRTREHGEVVMVSLTAVNNNNNHNNNNSHSGFSFGSDARFALGSPTPPRRASQHQQQQPQRSTYQRFNNDATDSGSTNGASPVPLSNAALAAHRNNSHLSLTADLIPAPPSPKTERPVVLVDADELVISVTPAAGHVLHLGSPHDLIGEGLSTLTRADDPDRIFNSNDLAALINRGTATTRGGVSAAIRAECVVRRGRLGWQRCRAVARPVEWEGRTVAEVEFITSATRHAETAGGAPARASPALSNMSIEM